MSFNKKDEEREEFEIFLDLNEDFDNEMNKNNPSRSRLKEILGKMQEIL